PSRPVWALGRIGPAARPAVPCLVKLLEAKPSRSGKVRQEAVRALGAIGPGAKEAVPVLTRMLRESASKGEEREWGPYPLRLDLGEANNPDPQQLDDAFADLTAEVLRLGPVVRDEVFAVARKTLFHPAAFENDRCAILLTDTDPKAAVPVLMEALKSPAMQIR